MCGARDQELSLGEASSIEILMAIRQLPPMGIGDPTKGGVSRKNLSGSARSSAQKMRGEVRSSVKRGFFQNDLGLLPYCSFARSALPGDLLVSKPLEHHQRNVALGQSQLPPIERRRNVVLWHGRRGERCGLRRQGFVTGLIRLLVRHLRRFRRLNHGICWQRRLGKHEGNWRNR